MGLEDLGLTRDMILSGEIAELDPVEPEKKTRKNPNPGPYYLAETVDMVIEAYNSDLRQAYERIQELEAELAEKDQHLNTQGEEIAQFQENNARLSQFSNLLGGLETKMNELQAGKQADLARIQQLQSSVEASDAKVNEARASFERAEEEAQAARQAANDLQESLEARDKEVKSIEDDVNAVLANLENLLAEYGLTPDEALNQ